MPLAGPDGKITTAKTIFDRLAAYENTGLEPEDISAPALWLGMTLYLVQEWEDGWQAAGKCTVVSLKINEDKTIIWVNTGEGMHHAVSSEEIGKTIFFTKEEAEQARRKRSC